ncbi:MAG: hypothetical protein IJD82_10095 [Clostridia bacterium]|nr:hypothetical protein [Clostridia bacterium]
MQQDERRVLTTRDIEKHLRGDVIVAVFALVLTLFYFGLAVMLCCLIPVAFPGGVLSVWWILTPTILVTAYLFLFVAYQIYVLVHACRVGYGRRYRLAPDTLYKICEGEHDRIPFFSADTLGRRRRYSFLTSRGSRYERPVTAYYFENNGRGTSYAFTLGDGDFEGDTFYLALDRKDGKILAAYNTKKYRLENME